MRTQAAVLYAAGTDWKVEDIELDPPRAGEVLVRVAAAGLCHSEEHHRVGDVPFTGPMIGGHEGAGYVEGAGPGVTLVQPGDYIVFSSIPNCGRCPSCVQGRQNLCDVVVLTMGTGRSDLMDSVLALTAKRGRVVVTNIYPMNDTRPRLALSGLAQWEKQIVGCIFGSVNSRADIPRLLNLYSGGLLDLDGMVTRTYPLEDINAGYADMHAGKNIRGVLVM